MYQLCIWRGRYDGFEAGKIHYEGHERDGPWKSETFLGPEMATSESRYVK
jgi:hypothetical protein